MGYQRKSYAIKWPEGHAHHGLEVKLRGLSGQDLLKVSSLRGENSMDEELLGEVFEILAERIIAWNLEDDGVPILPTVESVRGEDFGMIMDILGAWTEAVTSVLAPLGERSNSGEQSQELSIPMETL